MRQLSRVHCFYPKRPPTTKIYTLSLHDALPIYFTVLAQPQGCVAPVAPSIFAPASASSGAKIDGATGRSEEHTSELQSRRDLVCRLLLEKKKQDDMLWSSDYNRTLAAELVKRSI